MPVRSAALVVTNPTMQPNSGLDVATVPAGRTWLIKDANIQQLGPTTRSLTLGVRRGATQVPYLRPSAATATVYSTSGRFIVAEEGDVLYVFHGGADAAEVRVGIYGADLVGTAP